MAIIPAVVRKGLEDSKFKVILNYNMASETSLGQRFYFKKKNFKKLLVRFPYTFTILENI